MYADQPDRGHDAKTEVARRKIAELETKLARYRAAIEAGGDPAEIGQWIDEAKAERLKAERLKAERLKAERLKAVAELRMSKRSVRMSRSEIAALVAEIGDMARAITEAPAEFKNETYRRTGLRLTYHPDQKK